MIQSPFDSWLFPAILSEAENTWVRTDLDPRFHAALQTCLPVLPAAPDSWNSHRWLSFSALAILCCEAAGGVSGDALPVAAAWTLLYLAAHLVDSLSDCQMETGPDLALRSIDLPTLSTGLIASAEWILNTLSDRGVPHDIAGRLIFEFNRTILQMCSGQHLDLILQEPDLQQSWRMAEAKSGEFFALACKSGAILAKADAGQIECFQEFGLHLGVIVQISDDLRDLWRNGAEKSDISAGKWSLPVTYAMKVLPKEAAEILRNLLRKAADSAEAESNARKKMIDNGAAVYMMLAGQKRKYLASAALQRGCLASAARDQLLAILERVAKMGKE